MKLDKKLNFIVPIFESDEPDARPRVYVHSTPIGRETFERYFLSISKAFAMIYGEGLGAAAGPRVGALLIKRAALQIGDWEGPEGVENGLFAEMRRLTNVVVPGAKGWEAIPYEEALRRKTIDEDDSSVVENSLAFFTVASAMHRSKELSEAMVIASKLWSVLTSSSPLTEFVASLPTSTAPGSTGETATASSIPH